MTANVALTPADPATAPSARLLIVDGDARRMQALCTSLGAEGLDCLPCTDGRQALARLAEAGIAVDLLLTDLRLPEIACAELIRQVSVIDSDQVSLLMVTAQDGEEDDHGLAAALRAGALGCVLKPIETASLLASIDRALALRRMGQQNRAMQRSIDQHAQHIKQAQREVETLAGRLAHDLKAPLTNMLTILRMLREDDAHPLPADMDSLVQSGIESGERGHRMVDALQRFTRLSAVVPDIQAFAASVAQGQPFDVVFTDLGMPGMDGREVAAAIKGLSPNTPVAMLTGLGQAMLEDDETPPHVDLLIGKPPTAKSLRSALLQLNQSDAP